MTASRKDLSGEIACLAIFTVTGAFILFGAADLPAPEMDPLGPAGVPQYIALTILLLSAIRLGLLLWSARRADADISLQTTETPRYAEAAVLFSLALVYLLVLSIGGLPFSAVTLVFLAAAGFTMLRFAMSKLPIVIGIAVVMSFGLTFVFTDLLKVILPN